MFHNNILITLFKSQSPFLTDFVHTLCRTLCQSSALYTCGFEGGQSQSHKVLGKTLNILFSKRIFSSSVYIKFFYYIWRANINAG